MDKKNILIVIIVFLLSCLLLVIGSNPNTLSAKILGLESKIESPRQLYNVYLAGKSIGIIESKEALEKNIPLRQVEFSEEEKKLLKSYSFLTIKPIIYLANIDEDELGQEDNEYVKKVKEYAQKENAQVVSLCAKTEEDLSELTKEEKQEMLEAIGLSNSGLDDLIKATYDILGLATYFTVGKDEVRAWTFKKGMNAKECAGIIHTDFEKGFIRAEVISYTDLIECGSELKVKEAGKARLEGKEYLMQDGDICHFRFNV